MQDVAIVERLRTWSLDDFDARFAALTADLPEPDAAIAELLTRRRELFRQTASLHDPARGQEVFKQHCAACHQIGGAGAKIGPQLDGVGIRGADRLLEDILDPNRNVDAAFKTTALVMEDGRVLTGLIRREEGATLVLANAEGKEFTVATSDIDQRKDSRLSLMPAQLVEKISPESLGDLIVFLLQSSAPPPSGGAAPR
ncbi:MAG: c-type cytochrome [Planctomycetaceae bacterium]